MRTETRHSIVLTAGTGTTAVLSLIYTVYAGRQLGPERYADFTAAASFAFFCCIALGPINGTVARFSAQYASHGVPGKIRTLTSKTTKTVALVGLAGLVVGVLMLKPLAAVWHFSSYGPLVVAYGMVYLTLLLSVTRGVLRGVQSFNQYNVNILLEAAIRLVLGVTLLHLIGGATAGLVAYVLALVVVVIVSPWQLRGVWRGHKPAAIDGGEVRRFTIPMFVAIFTYAGYQNLDMFFVKGHFAASDAGQWSAAFALTRALGVLVTPFTILLLPLITTLHEKGHRIGPAFLRTCSYFLILAAGPLVLFWWWPVDTIKLLYADEYLAAAPLLLPLGAARLACYLTYLIVLTFASRARFGFLYVYVPGLAVEVAALFVWNDSLVAVAVAVLSTQVITMLSLGVFAATEARHRPGRADAIDVHLPRGP